MQTLVWTGGRDFPLARLESRLKCPRCGWRLVRLAFSVPPATQMMGHNHQDERSTALTANLFAFEPIRRLVPVLHILFGSDFPRAGEPTLIGTLNGTDEVELSDVDALAVNGGNAAKLFPVWA